MPLFISTSVINVCASLYRQVAAAPKDHIPSWLGPSSSLWCWNRTSSCRTETRRLLSWSSTSTTYLCASWKTVRASLCHYTVQRRLSELNLWLALNPQKHPRVTIAALHFLFEFLSFRKCCISCTFDNFKLSLRHQLLGIFLILDTMQYWHDALLKLFSFFLSISAVTLWRKKISPCILTVFVNMIDLISVTLEIFL